MASSTPRQMSLGVGGEGEGLGVHLPGGHVSPKNVSASLIPQSDDEKVQRHLRSQCPPCQAPNDVSAS